MDMSFTRNAAAAAALIVTALAGSASAGDQVASFGRWVSPEQAAAEAAAAPASGPAEVAPEWGAANSVYSIGACDFAPRNGVLDAQAGGCSLLNPVAAATGTTVGFPVHLPTGALITSIKMNYFDNHTPNPSVGLWRTSATGGQTLIALLSPPVFSGGNNTFTATGINHTVQNLGGSYAILAILTRDATGNTGIYGFEVNYTLQVSAPPAVATFPNDVPTTHPLFRFVEAMAASGLTGGCAPGSFCPDSPVTRGQLSVFLSVALGLHFPN